MSGVFFKEIFWNFSQIMFFFSIHMLMSIISYFSCIIDQPNRLTESVSKHVEVLVTLLVQKKLTMFILSSDLLTDCLFVCLFEPFWELQPLLYFHKLCCDFYRLWSLCVVSPINGRFARSVFSVQVISLPSGMNKDISQPLL